MDWKKYRLPLGAVALVVLIVAAIAISNQNKNEQVRGAGENEEIALPALKADEIDQLVIQKPGNPSVQFKKENDEWKMVEPLVSKVDQTSLDNALKKLTELKALGVAATKKANHDLLEVSNAKGIRIQAKYKDNMLLDAYIGSSKGGKTMLRLHNQDIVMSTKGSFQYVFSKELKNWRDRKIVDVDSKKIQHVAFKNSKMELSFKRDGDAWEQDEGRKIKDFKSSKVQSVVSSLSRLRANDFAAKDLDAIKTGVDSPVATVILTVVEENTNGLAEEDAVAGKAQEESTDDIQSSQIVLKLGQKQEDGESFYLMVDGNPTIYTIAKYQADKINADKEQFREKPEKK